MPERFVSMRAYLKALYKYYLPSFFSFPGNPDIDDEVDGRSDTGNTSLRSATNVSLRRCGVSMIVGAATLYLFHDLLLRSCLYSNVPGVL